MKVYLDDLRDTPEGWVRVYTVPELIRLFKEKHKEITDISLDNSLGLLPNGRERIQGIRFLQWLEARKAYGVPYNVPLLAFHSSDVNRWGEAKQILHRLQNEGE